MRLAGAIAVICFGVMPASADAPFRSLVPVMRPGGAPVTTPVAAGIVASGPTVVTVLATALAPGSSLRPTLRPATRRQATPQAPSSTTLAQAPEVEEPRRGFLGFLTGQNRRNQPAPRGALCGVSGIEGERLEPIPGRINGCGIAEPVRITAIDGIAINQSATINCDTARTLQGWLRDAVVPEVGRRGGGVATVRVIASYSCRTRNSRPGARISEHATGNAVDIAGIGLSDGSELTVLSDWGSGAEGRILRNLHEAACGPFGTVLGPNSDRYHQDHFHFDVASYRGGAYCR